jgi:uncharacterized protein (TIGR02147 family)
VSLAEAGSLLPADQPQCGIPDGRGPQRMSNPESSPMVNVFDYVDYRQYLADWFAEKKAAQPSYSYQLLAQKAGFANKGFVYNIIKGNKPLSKSNSAKISQAIGHNAYETEYFESIVAFSQAQTLKERNQYYEIISHLKNKGKGFSQAQILRHDQYEYFSKWYYSAVRSLIDMYRFTEDYRWLARTVNPPISVPQAKQAVRLLQRLGLIEQDSEGVYRLSDKSITSGQDITGLAVSNFHIECTRLAEKAIQELPRSERNITGLTLGISRQAYETICAKIAEFQDEVMQIANTDNQANQVYQFNFHLFPLSKPDHSKES